MTVVDQQRSALFHHLDSLAIKYDIVAHNLEEVVQQERHLMEMARSSVPSTFDYENNYHNYDQILAELKLVANSIPGKCNECLLE